MTNVDLARWQFGFVTVNHFFFVPVTIGLAFLVAVLQTAWASQLSGSRGRKLPRSSSRIRLPDGASVCASVPPPAPVPTMITS